MIKNKLIISIISDRQDLIASETKRVRWYLDNYPVYAAQGYVLRFPKGIDPKSGAKLDDLEIKNMVAAEVAADIKDYRDYAASIAKTWDTVKDKCVPVARAVYGFDPAGNFTIIPTIYGTNGGQTVWDGPVYCRLPKYRPANFKSEAEFIVHEILAHGVTAKLRNNTAIDESNPKATHQWHKERLMDLLGRTFLVRSAMMGFSEVMMQEKAQQIAAAEVDPLYCQNPLSSSENELRYEGKFAQLVFDLDSKLKHSQ